MPIDSREGKQSVDKRPFESLHASAVLASPASLNPIDAREIYSRQLRIGGIRTTAGAIKHANAFGKGVARWKRIPLRENRLVAENAGIEAETYPENVEGIRSS